MSEKVVVLGIKKQPNWLYFLDKDGNISRTSATRLKKKSLIAPQKTEIVAELNIKRDNTFLYYVDKDGDLSKTKLVRGKKSVSDEEKYKL
jgi:hypothetical protein